MQFDSLDDYLLNGTGSKAAIIDGLLAHRSDDPHAAPFYRALEIMGAKAADEALMALRLVLSGRVPDDEAIKRMRKSVAEARKGGPEAEDARAAYSAEVKQPPAN